MKGPDDSQRFVRILREQACWANVCTEPGMVALMTARAADLAGEPALQIEVCLSGGILKNALSAGLPHIQVKGPDIAAAAGAVVRDPSKGLTILGNLSEAQMGEALSLARAGRVTVKWDSAHQGVYGKCILRTKNHVAEVVVEGSHTNITEEKLDGRLLVSAASTSTTSGLFALREWKFERLIDIIMSVDPVELDWLLQGARSSSDLAEAADDLACCHDIVMWPASCTTVSSGDWPAMEAANRAAKAICARMNGCAWPVLTSGGSGNQGIMIATSVLSLASSLGLAERRTIQALALAHGVNMLVKSYMGEISSSCGGVSAGAGVAAAVSWMMGGTKEQMAEAVTEVLGSLFGMVCDGAKTTCALKGWVAVTSGISIGQWAANRRAKTQNQGVIGRSLEDTLARLETINKTVFSRSDDLILSLMGVERV